MSLQPTMLRVQDGDYSFFTIAMHDRWRGKINAQGTLLSAWFKINTQSLNADKIMAFNIHDIGKCLDRIDVQTDGISVEVVSEAKFNGVIIGSKLDWSSMYLTWKLGFLK